MFCHVKIHSTFVCSLRTGVTVTFRSPQYCQCGFVVIVQKMHKNIRLLCSRERCGAHFPHRWAYSSS